jgi:hypothetical protein
MRALSNVKGKTMFPPLYGRDTLSLLWRKLQNRF